MNIGLIGYGFMGGAHLAALTATPGATLRAVATRTRPTGDAPTRGNLDLKCVPLPAEVAWTPDWQTVVDDPTLDAVDICLPTHLHREVILRALAQGKHVLCEKPMALTPRECDEILEAADRAGRTLMVAQVLRFTTPYRQAGSFVQASERLESCTLRRTTGYPQWSPWLADRAQSGGAILDLLSHDLDQVLAWFGPPGGLSAVTLGEVDTVRATLLYPGGPCVVVEGGWLGPDTPFAQSFCLEAEAATLTFAEGELRRTHAAVSERIDLPAQDAYAEEIAYFLDCCQTGAVPSLCPPAASADAVRLATLVYRSREQNGKELLWQ